MLKVLKSEPANLDAELTVAEMYQLFIRENPDLKLAAYWVFNDTLNYEFIISFGFPCGDIFDMCERLTTQIKATMGTSEEAMRLFCEQEHEHEHP